MKRLDWILLTMFIIMASTASFDIRISLGVYCVVFSVMLAVELADLESHWKRQKDNYPLSLIPEDSRKDALIGLLMVGSAIWFVFPFMTLAGWGND